MLLCRFLRTLLTLSNPLWPRSRTCQIRCKAKQSPAPFYTRPARKKSRLPPSSGSAEERFQSDDGRRWQIPRPCWGRNDPDAPASPRHSSAYSPETALGHNGQGPPAIESWKFRRSKWCRKNRKYWSPLFSTTVAMYSLILPTGGGSGSSWNTQRTSRMVRPSDWNGNLLM